MRNLQEQLDECRQALDTANALIGAQAEANDKLVSKLNDKISSLITENNELLQQIQIYDGAMGVQKERIQDLEKRLDQALDDHAL